MKSGVTRVVLAPGGKLCPIMPPLAVGKPLSPMKNMVIEVSPFGRSPPTTLTYEYAEATLSVNRVPQPANFSRGLLPGGNAA
jgi:hypothetical protein